jgi:two-component sensor histidine kinase/REP element-mobilizing transposase RayT
MTRSFFAVCGVIVILFEAHAQDNPVHLLQQYAKSKPDTSRVNLLIKLSSYYLFKPGEIQRDLDSAVMLAKEAKQLSRQLQYSEGEGQADFWIGRSYVEARNYSAVNTLLKAVSDTTRIKVLLQLADYKLYTTGNTKVDWDSSLFYASRAFENSQAIQSISLELESIERLVSYYVIFRELDKLKTVLMRAIAICKKSGYPEKVAEIQTKLMRSFSSDKEGYAQVASLWKEGLADCKNASEKKNMQAVEDIILKGLSQNIFPGDILLNDMEDKGEGYYLNTIELLGTRAEQYPMCFINLCYVYLIKGDYAKSLSYGLKAERLAKNITTEMPPIAYHVLGQLYFRRGNIEESITYFQKAIAEARRKRINPTGLVYKYLVRAYIAQNKTQEALVSLEDASKDSAIFGIYDKYEIDDSRGIIYTTLGNFQKAEQYYLQCQELAKNMKASDQALNYAALSRFYVQSKQYIKAKGYLDILNKSENKNYLALFIQAEMALLRFRADSALGNYKNAISSLLENKLLNDSIFNETKNKQFEELKIQYETDKKNKDISILEGKEKLSQVQLLNTKNTQKWIITGAAMLLIIAGLFYRLALIRKRSNKIVKTKNDQLKHLLTEKEWLLKEIHHRVKNNLQIVMSLLNSQSAYIDNEPALTAIHDSQHRVHAMSLIHQKLYNSENLSSIDMSSYIRELVSYLTDSFDTGQRIRFDLAVDPLEMDVSQAVPLGLILNEAITNSIKYAFPDGRSGVVSISLSNVSSDHYLLIISDNGIGMPDSNIKKSGSLGMSLMKGLSEDLEGNLSIDNENGTTLKISFVYEKNINRHSILAEIFVSNN